MIRIKYRKRKSLHKYVLHTHVRVEIPEFDDLPWAYIPDYAALGGGVLDILPGYAWDGPSGPTVDSKNAMPPSLVHDVFYQMFREGRLSAKKYRKRVDQLYRKHCIACGMSKFRAGYQYAALRAFGGFAAKRNPKPVVYDAP